jgi:hypothetical protein
MPAAAIAGASRPPATLATVSSAAHPHTCKTTWKQPDSHRLPSLFAQQCPLSTPHYSASNHSTQLSIDISPAADTPLLRQSLLNSVPLLLQPLPGGLALSQGIVTLLLRRSQQPNTPQPTCPPNNRIRTDVFVSASTALVWSSSILRFSWSYFICCSRITWSCTFWHKQQLECYAV